jgi:hypothetical protein
MAKRFLGFCLSILAGIVLLYLAVQLLAQFWGWLLLIALLCAAIYVTVAFVRWRRSRW